MQNERLQHKLQNEVYLKEFLWLKRFIKHETSFDVSVQRMDRSLLAENQFFKKEVSAGHFQQETQLIVLLDEVGDTLLTVGKPQPHFIHIPFLSSRREDDMGIRHETVGEALFRLGADKVEKIHYIIIRRFNHFTIYKLPKGFTLKGWMGEMVAESRKKLNGELVEANTIVINLPPSHH